MNLTFVCKFFLFFFRTKKENWENCLKNCCATNTFSDEKAEKNIKGKDQNSRVSQIQAKRNETEIHTTSSLRLYHQVIIAQYETNESLF